MPLREAGTPQTDVVAPVARHPPLHEGAPLEGLTVRSLRQPYQRAAERHLFAQHDGQQRVLVGQLKAFEVFVQGVDVEEHKDGPCLVRAAAPGG